MNLIEFVMLYDQENWDILEVTREGTNQAKESKINLFKYQYELFRMENDESQKILFSFDL